MAKLKDTMTLAIWQLLVMRNTIGGCMELSMRLEFTTVLHRNAVFIPREVHGIPFHNRRNRHEIPAVFKVH
jgi:hypothetical protein